VKPVQQIKPRTNIILVSQPTDSLIILWCSFSCSCYMA